MHKFAPTQQLTKRCKVSGKGSTSYKATDRAKGSSGNNMTIWMSVTCINKPVIPYQLVNLFAEEP